MRTSVCGCAWGGCGGALGWKVTKKRQNTLEFTSWRDKESREGEVMKRGWRIPKTFYHYTRTHAERKVEEKDTHYRWRVSTREIKPRIGTCVFSHYGG